MPRNDQVIRQWKILKLLEARGRVTLARLADDARLRRVTFQYRGAVSGIKSVSFRFDSLFQNDCR